MRLGHCDVKQPSERGAVVALRVEAPLAPTMPIDSVKEIVAPAVGKRADVVKAAGTAVEVVDLRGRAHHADQDHLPIVTLRRTA